MTTSDAQECVTKTCTKCGDKKSLDCFGFKNKGKQWLHSHCRTCRNEYSKQWYKNNCEYVKHKRREYRMANKERISAYEKFRYVKGSRREYQKLRRKINPIPHREQVRKWRSENKLVVREYVRKWRIKNPEKRREIDRRSVISLSDSYIKRGFFRGLDAPTDLISIKRALLRIYRATKQLEAVANERIEKCNGK